MGGVFFCSIHFVQMYLRTHDFGPPEEVPLANSESVELRNFATMMIEGGEVLLVICLSFLNIVFLKRRETFKFLFNQLVDYNKKMAGKSETYIIGNNLDKNPV